MSPRPIHSVTVRSHRPPRRVKPRHLIAIAAAVPMTIGIASVAEHAMRPAKPSQMQPPVVREVAPQSAAQAVEYKPMTAEQAEQDRYMRALYAQLNADITSGRRADTKPGVVEDDDVEGVNWWVERESEYLLQPEPIFDALPVADIAEPVIASTAEQIAAINPPSFIHHRIGGTCCDDVRVIVPRGPDRQPVAVPEPGSLPMLLAGVAALVWWRARA